MTMTVGALRAFLALFSAKQPVFIALPERRIEALVLAEVDPFDDEEGVLLWPETVSYEEIEKDHAR